MFKAFLYLRICISMLHLSISIFLFYFVSNNTINLPFIVLVIGKKLNYYLLSFPRDTNSKFDIYLYVYQFFLIYFSFSLLAVVVIFLNYILLYTLFAFPLKNLSVVCFLFFIYFIFLKVSRTKSSIPQQHKEKKKDIYISAVQVL